MIKKNYFHLFFLFILLIYYIFPLITVGQVIVNPNDIFDSFVVYDHIIAKIYKGDFSSVGYFLSGEIQWFYLERLFHPLNLLHYILNDKLFYFTNDILLTLSAYFAFYLLGKSLKVSKFESALGAILYSTIIHLKIPFGLAIPFLPYILYLLVNKNTLKIKHIILVLFIGLNSSLIQDFFALFFLIPLSFLIKKKNNTNVYIQIFSIIFISLILTNIHLIMGTFLSAPIHREEFIMRIDFISLYESLKNLFLIFGYENPFFFFKIPLIFLFTLLLIFSIFSSEKNIKSILLFIIFISLLEQFFSYNFIDNIFIGPLEALKGFSFTRVNRILPLALSLLFILYISKSKYKNLKILLYFVSVISLFSLQLKTSLPVVTEYFLMKNMNINKFNEAKVNILSQNYFKVIKIIIEKENYQKNDIDFYSSINETFDNYYKFQDYEFIKNYIGDSRVMSVGLDPMIAVMNDIKTIDGYHTVYPLEYKHKFRKLIERELENNYELKNYYDNWGSRVYAYYNDENNLMLDFKYGKILGADYVISRIPITHKDLKMICYKCNNSKHIFLYKIL